MHVKVRKKSLGVGFRLKNTINMNINMKGDRSDIMPSSKEKICELDWPNVNRL